MLVNSITFVLLLAIALCCLESGAASTTCVCSEQMGGICFYQPATATSVPTDLWSCNQINGTLKIDISGNIDFTTQSFFANYIYGDIEFYADSSISTTPVTISFPFLDGWRVFLPMKYVYLLVFAHILRMFKLRVCGFIFQQSGSSLLDVANRLFSLP